MPENITHANTTTSYRKYQYRQEYNALDTNIVYTETTAVVDLWSQENQTTTLTDEKG